LLRKPVVSVPAPGPRAIVSKTSYR
jgi:hypothetical protein